MKDPVTTWGIRVDPVEQKAYLRVTIRLQDRHHSMTFSEVEIPLTFTEYLSVKLGQEMDGGLQLQ